MSNRVDAPTWLGKFVHAAVDSALFVHTTAFHKYILHRDEVVIAEDLKTGEPYESYRAKNGVDIGQLAQTIRAAHNKLSKHNYF